ncbi:MAG TPA: RDD family protein [Streptosporangiaceae bacterium]|jgi:uncharacterized RDD family membrane protein YckC|nr:RDD family protein [Streptosporangiaceae bacterium]
MAEVVTGEAVVLDLAVARFPSRIIAQLLDICVQLPAIAFVEIVVLRSAAQHLNGASAAAVLILGVVAVIIGYPVAFETLSRGKTLGKLAMGLRVVSDDGGPERFRQALIRALSAAFIEIWGFPINLIGMPAGLITSMASAKGKRLGDVFAGTFVIQERAPARPDLIPAFTFVAPPLLGWAQHLELSRLPDHVAANASSYLRRYYQLRPAARAQIGWQLATEVAAYVSPPPPGGTPPEAYLAAVLAVRRDREQARLAQRQAAQARLVAGAPPAGSWAGPDGPVAGGTAMPDTKPADWTEPVPADAPSAPAPPEDYGFAKPF